MTTQAPAASTAELSVELCPAALPIAAKFADLQCKAARAFTDAHNTADKVKGGQLALIGELRIAGVSAKAGKLFADAVATAYEAKAKAAKLPDGAATLTASYIKQLGSYCNALLACSAEEFAAATKDKTSVQNAYKALKESQRDPNEEPKARKPRQPKGGASDTDEGSEGGEIRAKGFVLETPKECIDTAAKALATLRELLKDQGATKDVLRAVAGLATEVEDLADLL